MPTADQLQKDAITKIRDIIKDHDEEDQVDDTVKAVKKIIDKHKEKTEKKGKKDEKDMKKKDEKKKAEKKKADKKKKEEDDEEKEEPEESKDDTEEILKAAETKWNFISFRPGLVGGHCIGVDPYYLTYKAQQVDYNPQVILSGRKINDGMASFISDTFLSKLSKLSCNLKESNILILGYSFKENCNDIRKNKTND